MSVDIVKITAAQAGAATGVPRKAASADSADTPSHVSFGATLAARRAQGEAANDPKAGATARTDSHPAAGTTQRAAAGQTANANDLRPTAAKSLEAGEHPASQPELAVAVRADAPAAGEESPRVTERPRVAEHKNTTADADAARTSDPALALDALLARAGGNTPAADTDSPASASHTNPARTDDRKKQAASDKAAAALAATPADPAAAALAAAALPQAAQTADNKPHSLGDEQDGNPRGRLPAINDKTLAGSHGKGAQTAGEQLAEAARQGADARTAGSRDAMLQGVKADGFERAFAQAVKPGHGETSGRTGQAGDPSSLLAGLHANTAAGHSQSALAASAPAQNAAALNAQINAPVGSEAWNQALNQHSLRLTHFGDGTAELKLHPQELGQLQISLKMGEHAQLHFFSPHADVRAAVEAALPQLRQAFANNGINLGQTSVSDQGAHNPSDNPQSGGSSHGGRRDQPLDDVVSRPVRITAIAGRTLDGGIDIFA